MVGRKEKVRYLFILCNLLITSLYSMVIAKGSWKTNKTFLMYLLIYKHLFQLEFQNNLTHLFAVSLKINTVIVNKIKNPLVYLIFTFVIVMPVKKEVITRTAVLSELECIGVSFNLVQNVMNESL